jgi:flagellar hook-associated protein 1 FlgK
LNNFFVSNKPIATGDTTEGSAFAMQVAQRIVKNPNLLATGKMALSSQPANPNSPAQYTYVRYSGDNSLGQALAGAAETPLAFDGAGTLAGGANTLNGYLAQVMSHVATLAATADTDASNAETLYNGFKTKLDTVTGVNLDEELANTITYQNAYSASAKMIKVASDLYQDLLQLF